MNHMAVQCEVVSLFGAVSVHRTQGGVESGQGWAGPDLVSDDDLEERC